MGQIKYTEHMLLCSLLLLLSYVVFSDLKFRRISNKAVGCALFLSMLIGHNHFSIEYIYSLAFLYFVLLIIYGLKVIGGGDIKLMAALSLATPSSFWPYTYVVITVIGGLLALVYLILPFIDNRFQLGLIKVFGIPYGIAISFGFVFSIMQYIYVGEV
jgi:prepilin peptidase CpaA